MKICSICSRYVNEHPSSLDGRPWRYTSVGSYFLKFNRPPLPIVSTGRRMGHTYFRSPKWPLKQQYYFSSRLCPVVRFVVGLIPESHVWAWAGRLRLSGGASYNPGRQTTVIRRCFLQPGQADYGYQAVLPITWAGRLRLSGGAF